MTWKIEKLDLFGKRETDICLWIRGICIFSFMHEDCGYQNLILFNHIIWDRIGD